MSERTIENVREYNLDPKEVIAGLNGYYESDKRNGYITVRRNDVEGPVYFTAALYLSALIEWLREDYDIFYRPGMTLDQVEAARSAAKICGLRAHIKDELGKRGLWCDKDADIPALVDTLFEAYDECSKARDRNRKDAAKLSEVSRELRKEVNALKDKETAVCKDIMNYIRQEASRNGFDLPEEIDGGPLTIKRVFRDLLELFMKRTAEIREVNDKRWKDLRDIYKALGCGGMNGHIDDFAKAVKARAEYVESLSRNTEKSDANKLIRDCCVKHNVVAPSRYLSDEACVEYLFSIIEQKDRSFAILQNLYRDIFKKQPDGLSVEDIANKILDKVLETEALLHLESVDNYKLSLKDYILHDIKKRGYRYDGLETKSIEEVVDWIITMATCANKTVEDVQKETKRECYDYLWNALNKLSPECDALKIDHYEDLVDRIFFEMCFITENCKQCQRKHTTEKFDYIRRTNKAEEEVKKLNDVIKKLKELLNEINKEEDGEWFKP